MFQPAVFAEAFDGDNVPCDFLLLRSSNCITSAELCFDLIPTVSKPANFTIIIILSTSQFENLFNISIQLQDITLSVFEVSFGVRSLLVLRIYPERLPIII